MKSMQIVYSVNRVSPSDNSMSEHFQVKLNVAIAIITGLLKYPFCLPNTPTKHKTFFPNTKKNARKGFRFEINTLTCHHAGRQGRADSEKLLRGEGGAEVMQDLKAEASPPASSPHQQSVQDRQQVAAAAPAVTESA